MKHIVEPSKQIPIVYEADVVVGGGGISGIFAALAAARTGAKTVLVDRFGVLGGNMGPGVIAGGSADNETGVVGGPFGLPKELFDRVASERDCQPGLYADMSNRVSYVTLQMMREAGVHLMLSTSVTDPILDGSKVAGLFVENKSGRQAVTAQVVIDATGDADLVARAGGPVIRQTDSSPQNVEDVIKDMQERFRGVITEEEQACLEGQLRGRGAAMGLWYMIAGVDWAKFEQYAKQVGDPSEDDLNWYRKNVSDPPVIPDCYMPLVPHLRAAAKTGEFVINKDVDGLGKVFLGRLHAADRNAGLVSGRIGGAGQFDPGNGEHISKAEACFRSYIYEMTGFLRKYVPGFEEGYLLTMAPFLGARAGRYIEGEYTVTAVDFADRSKFDDVVYIYELRSDGGKPLNISIDVPYRIMIPKQIEGIIATGRSASYGRVLRTRRSCMTMGQVGGTAAALSAKEHVTPRALDIKHLQRQLLEDGVYLGDKLRLKELSL